MREKKVELWKIVIHTQTNEGRKVAVECQFVLHVVHHDSSFH